LRIRTFRSRVGFRSAGAALLAALAIQAAGCGSNSYDASTDRGKRALLDEVRIKLSQGDCSAAIELLKPTYNSENTDNNVRMMMAATYGCASGLNYFTLLGDIVSKIDSLASGGIWGFVATEFKSTPDDTIPEAGVNAQDALQAVISPSAVVLADDLFNSDTFNPQAYAVKNRIDDATAYLFFTSMAVMGGYESRYGSPLPWTDQTLVTNDGCRYASGVVNFADSLTGLVDTTSGKVQTTFSSLKDGIQSAIYSACDTACKTLCGYAAGCATCPKELRDHTSCTAGATDLPSCAAAGIVSAVNLLWDGS
jgi:hypothetical protein